ncbi:MAG: haloacid dehalogenase-like hydrolase [Polyangiaceae bacterium]
MSARVVLLDIDGTLLDCGGAGRAAMQRAVAQHTGRDDVLSFRFGGLTDRLIVRKALQCASAEVSEERIDAVLEVYLALLPDALAGTAAFRTLPGATELVTELARVSGVALGLGTGNVEGGARLKLERAGLWQFFTFGGFGNDHESRDELLRAGARRGAAQLGVDAAALVVVGDTPHDVAAAHAIDAMAVAVSSGGYDAAALQAAGADLVVERLDDPRLRALLFAREHRP